MSISSEKLRKVLHPIQIDTMHFRFKPRRNPGSQSQHRSVNRTAVNVGGSSRVRPRFLKYLSPMVPAMGWLSFHNRAARSMFFAWLAPTPDVGADRGGAGRSIASPSQSADHLMASDIDMLFVSRTRSSMSPASSPDAKSHQMPRLAPTRWTPRLSPGSPRTLPTRNSAPILEPAGNCWPHSDSAFSALLRYQRRPIAPQSS